MTTTRFGQLGKCGIWHEHIHRDCDEWIRDRATTNNVHIK